MKKIISCLAVLLLTAPYVSQAQKGVQHMIVTADLHYGLTRPHFRGKDSVDAVDVNRAMINAINKLPKTSLPQDNGAGAGQRVGRVEGVAILGDLITRNQGPTPIASITWKQFEGDYYHRLKIKDSKGKHAPLWLIGGNHEVANTLGNFKLNTPKEDPSAMVGIYNLEMTPTRKRTNATYNYQTDKVRFSKDLGMVHLQFVNLWPDRVERKWMEEDLNKVNPSTPVLMFAHSDPKVEGRFFVNPNGDHSANAKDGFENLVTDTFRDGNYVKNRSAVEEVELANFLKAHPQIKAYFHGHTNYNEFYDWKVPEVDYSLPTFRVESNIKGKKSRADERLLSFQLVTIDNDAKKMTVREVLWNAQPEDPNHIEWGTSRTLDLM